PSCAQHPRIPWNQPSDARELHQRLACPDLRTKLLFTAAMLAVYRLGSHLPAPAVNPNAINVGGSSFLNLLNTFGGGLSRLSIFALGIMPYITASIILQVMTPVFPSLQELQKEGELGQRRITQ